MVDTNAATRSLRLAADGEARGVAELTPLMYEELRALAACRLAGERRGHTLQPTALVHEAFIRLIDQSRARYRDKTHFMAIAARTMRRVLVDHARGRKRLKRGGEGWRRVTLTTRFEPAETREIDLLVLEDLLEKLEQLNQRHARITELRLFGELGNAEIAETLGVSETTVKDDWRAARAWLQLHLKAS